jgi:hypothetical protein
MYSIMACACGCGDTDTTRRGLCCCSARVLGRAVDVAATPAACLPVLEADRALQAAVRHLGALGLGALLAGAGHPG